MTTAAAVFALTLVVSVVLTKLTRNVALRWGFTDKPDQERKLHKQPTALGGGVALFLSTLFALVLLIVVPNVWQAELLDAWMDLSALFVAAVVIVAVGLLDDRYKLRGVQKLLGQILAACVLVACGLVIKRVEIFGWNIELGPFSGVMTIIWLLGAINAINLLDGIDGLASTIGFVLMASIAIMAALFGNWPVSIVAAMFSASLLGFLRYNFPPATIFLGDAGSMLIGLALGTLAIQGSLKGAGTVLMAAPLAFWTIPFFDSAAAIVRRKLTGRSIYDVDRAHLHHCLMRRFGSNRKVVAWVAICCCFTAIAAFVSVILHADAIALLGCSSVIVLLITTRLFGHAEFALVLARLSEFRLPHTRWSANETPSTREVTVRLQGHRRWERIWESLTEEAHRLGLVRVRLSLNLPILEEGFHGNWQRATAPGGMPCWRAELPLFASGQAVGRLLVVGEPGSMGAFREMELIMAVLAPLEEMLSEIVDDVGGQAPTVISPSAPAPAPGASHLADVIAVTSS